MFTLLRIAIPITCPRKLYVSRKELEVWPGATTTLSFPGASSKAQLGLGRRSGRMHCFALRRVAFIKMAIEHRAQTTANQNKKKNNEEELNMSTNEFYSTSIFSEGSD